MIWRKKKNNITQIIALSSLRLSLECENFSCSCVFPKKMNWFTWNFYIISQIPGGLNIFGDAKRLRPEKLKLIDQCLGSWSPSYRWFRYSAWQVPRYPQRAKQGTNQTKATYTWTITIKECTTSSSYLQGQKHKCESVSRTQDRIRMGAMEVHSRWSGYAWDWAA
jgi:hypothetical protein